MKKFITGILLFTLALFVSSCNAVTATAGPQHGETCYVDATLNSVDVQVVSQITVPESPGTVIQKTSSTNIYGEIENARSYRVYSPLAGYLSRQWYACTLPDKISKGFGNNINAPPNKSTEV
jgi:hypothetical protein